MPSNPPIFSNKALFLDRDGVINVDRGYVHRREDFQFTDGIFDLCTSAQALLYQLVVVTNQAGIAKGYFTESEFQALTNWMVAEFAARRIGIERVYYCPYHAVYGVGRYKADSPDRKPKPGMFLKARTDLSLDLSQSVVIGDQLSDLVAAETAGVGTKIWLRPGSPEGLVQPGSYYISNSLTQIRHGFFS